jgi:hypothetical protein
MYPVNSISKIRYSSPANFSITIKGRLDKNLSDNFGGLTIHNLSTYDNTQISYLEGKILDQAALIGVLISLYNMRYTILTIEIVDT